MNVTLVLLYLGAFVLGSIPFGYLAGKLNGVDVRSVGSGNIGATNVIRALGKGWGISVFLLDVLKGAVPGWIAMMLFPTGLGSLDAQTVWFLAGLCAVLGHVFSPFLRFRGGKGIATALGMVVGAAPWVALGAFSVFLIVLFVTRYVSVSSIIAVGTAILFGALVPGYSHQLVAAYVLVWLFVVYTHRANIQRLRQGTEKRFSFQKEKGHAA